MSEYLLMCRSLTHAQRSQRTLERAGIHSVLFRAPEKLRSGGCGYALRLREHRLREVPDILEASGLTMGKLYRKTETEYEEAEV